jgi:hypothetical protein
LRLLVNVAIFVLAELLFADLALTGFVTRARARGGAGRRAASGLSLDCRRFSVLTGSTAAASEVGGRLRQQADGNSTELNVELSLPIFRLALAVFIPWRGADGFDRRAGWHPR